MTIFSDFPVPLSTAATVRIPLARRIRKTQVSSRSSSMGGRSTLTIHLESDLDLRLTTRSGGNVGQIELAEQVVVLRHGTFTLVNLNGDYWLVVNGGREDLGLLGRDDSVSSTTFNEVCLSAVAFVKTMAEDLHQLGHDTSGSLNSQRQGAYINQQHIAAALFSGQDSSLDGGTVSYGLIWVDTPGRLFAVEEILEKLLNLGDTSRTSDKYDLKVCSQSQNLSELEDCVSCVHSHHRYPPS